MNSIFIPILVCALTVAAAFIFGKLALRDEKKRRAKQLS